MPQALIALGANEPWPDSALSRPLSERHWAKGHSVPPEFTSLAANLDRAVAHMAATPGIRLLAQSHWHPTAPAGGPLGQPAFLNGVVRIETELAPIALLDQLQAVERRGGRQRLVPWGPRTIDLDLLMYDDLVFSSPRLELPHPRLGYRRFVIAPAAEVAADWRHPCIGWTIGELARHVAMPLNLVAVIGRDRPAIARLIQSVLDRVPGDYLRFPSVSRADFSSDASSDASSDVQGRGVRASVADDELLEWRGRLLEASQAAVLASRPLLCDFWPTHERLAPRRGNDAVALPTPKLWVGIMGDSLGSNGSETPMASAASATDDASLRCWVTTPGRGPWLVLDLDASGWAVEEIVGAIEAFR